MRILWLTWKDTSHPEAGGAETLNEVLAREMVADGHEVIFLVGGFAGCVKTDERDGYRIIRTGNRYTVYLTTAFYYLNNLASWPDLIIEEINTVPFMTQWYAKQKRILLIYQLCREIWFYQLWFPLNLIGYILEPIYLWLLRKNTVLTESESTRNDLARFGFDKKNTTVFPVAINQTIQTPTSLRGLTDLARTKQSVISPEFLQSRNPESSPHNPTLLSFGSIRPMKRTLDQIKAFEIAHESIPDLKLIVAGSAKSSYGQKVLRYMQQSKFATDITYAGVVNEDKKIELMRQAHLIMVTSVKEGWGLIVTEAGLQGTPAVVYDVDGLRDTVQNGKTGMVTKSNTPTSLAHTIIDLLKSDAYSEMRNEAKHYNTRFTAKNSYAILSKLLVK